VPSSQLARDGGLPERFLLQILRKLVNHGILESICGSQGGYYLARPTSQITLRQVADALDDAAEIVLPNIQNASPDILLRLSQVLHQASQATKASLDKVVVSDITRGLSKRKGAEERPASQDARSDSSIDLTPLEPNSTPSDSDSSIIH
jgi:Rrf2 family protein